MSDERTVRVRLYDGGRRGCDGIIELWDELKKFGDRDVEVVVRPVPPPPEPRRWVFEETGEVRPPKIGEWYAGYRQETGPAVVPMAALLDFSASYPILRLVESTPPPPERVAKEAKANIRLWCEGDSKIPIIEGVDKLWNAAVQLGDVSHDGRYTVVVRPPEPTKRRVRKLELREAKMGERYFFSNESKALGNEGKVWVIVEETEEE